MVMVPYRCKYVQAAWIVHGFIRRSSFKAVAALAPRPSYRHRGVKPALSANAAELQVGQTLLWPDSLYSILRGFSPLRTQEGHLPDNLSMSCSIVILRPRLLDELLN